MKKNIVASIKAKLTQISKKRNKDFSSICLQYCQERFLYRLSLSEYKNNFILKGGLSLIAVNISSNRPTKDIDFLGKNIKNDSSVIKEIFIKILKNSFYDDGLNFDTESITTEKIAEESLYEGVRVNINAFLDKSIYKIIIDIGFSDRLLNEVELIEFPNILDSFESPKISVYPLEAIISEKFEAIVKLYTLNSRLKDFYDIYFLSKTKNFDIVNLHKNINNTFNNRNTPILDRKLIFEKNYKENIDMDKKWKAFLKRNKIDLEISFHNLIEHLEKFIELPFNNDSGYVWDYNLQEWKLYK